MAKKQLTDLIIKLYSKLGGNVSDVLGTRSNISFLGVGKSPEGFIDSTINIDAIGALGKNKVLNELKSSMGYLTGGKLNDVQAGKLYQNMLKIDEVFNPPEFVSQEAALKGGANIIDLRTGIRNLDQEGIASLRAEEKLAEDVMANVSDAEYTIRGYFPKASDAEIKRMLDNPSKEVREILDVEGIDLPAALRATRKTDDDMRIIKEEVDLPPPGSRGGPDDIAAPVQQYSNEIEALETMTKNKAGSEFITGYVDDVYRNSGVTASVDIAKKRGAAREFLFTMLKKETDLLPQGGTLESVISPTDYKYIMEGGGGALGDPLILVKKYFGDTIAKRIPLNSDRVIIEEFVDNVRFTKDKAGFATDDPRFNPDDIPEFKHGGLAKILEV